MIFRALTLLAIISLTILALFTVGVVRGRASADKIMRQVKGHWVRTQTKFSPIRGSDDTAAQFWEFYYEAQDPEYQRSAPVMISANIFGNLPHRLTIRFVQSHPAAGLPPGAVSVPRDKAYALSSPFWNQPYTLSLKSTRLEKKP